MVNENTPSFYNDSLILHQNRLGEKPAAVTSTSRSEEVRCGTNVGQMWDRCGSWWAGAESGAELPDLTKWKNDLPMIN